MDILGTQTAQTNGIFLATFDTFWSGARHLLHMFPATTVESVACTLCDCSSQPQVSSTQNSVKSKAPGPSCDFAHFGHACCLLLA